MTDRIRIVEVGPRDGLQSRSDSPSGKMLPLESRIEWIEKLIGSGVEEIEAGAFVREDRVPAMAGSAEVFEHFRDRHDVRLWALIPNLKGWQLADAAGASNFAFFTSVSEGFSLHNTGHSLQQSRQAFDEIVAARGSAPLRGYLSCCFGCPYDGEIEARQVLEAALQLHGAGADEIVISDTTGIATADGVTRVVETVAEEIPLEILSLHLHDTHGSAVDCARAGLETGIRSFDGSAGGLGGCPFAPGAMGNIATEDLLLLMHQQGYSTPIDGAALMQSSLWLEGELGETLPARALGDLRN